MYVSTSTSRPKEFVSQNILHYQSSRLQKDRFKLFNCQRPFHWKQFNYKELHQDLKLCFPYDTVRALDSIVKLPCQFSIRYSKTLLFLTRNFVWTYFFVICFEWKLYAGNLSNFILHRLLFKIVHIYGWILSSYPNGLYARFKNNH